MLALLSSIAILLTGVVLVVTAFQIIYTQLLHAFGGNY